MSKHLTFYHYVVGDIDSKEYNPSFPFGGIKKDAPEQMKKDYDRFCKEYQSCVDRLVSEGETVEEANKEVKEYFDWIKQEITKKCANAWKEHVKQNKKRF